MKEGNKTDKNLMRHCRLRSMPHAKIPYAVNAYMIGNKFGEIIGGNLMQYMFNNEQNNLCFPTVFKSRRSVDQFLRVNEAKVTNIENYCYDYNQGDYDA